MLNSEFVLVVIYSLVPVSSLVSGMCDLWFSWDLHFLVTVVASGPVGSLYSSLRLGEEQKGKKMIGDRGY